MDRGNGFAVRLIYGAHAQAETVRNPDTLVEATPNSIETLDPHFMLSSATTCIAYNVYDSLLASKADGTLTPCLATRVPSIENKLIRIGADGKNGNGCSSWPTHWG